jgi:hypothetical protein
LVKRRRKLAKRMQANKIPIIIIIKFFIIIILNIAEPRTLTDFLARRNEMDGIRSTHWKERMSYKMLIRKPERKRLLWIRRRRTEDNIKMNLEGIECVVIDRIRSIGGIL